MISSRAMLLLVFWLDSASNKKRQLLAIIHLKYVKNIVIMMQTKLLAMILINNIIEMQLSANKK